MYIAVCDDDSSEVSRIDSFLHSWEAQRRQPLRRRLFSNATELLDAARQEKFTLYLLDIIMPGVDGISAARELRGSGCEADIAFLTSSPEYAWESYRVHALDYLLKPVDGELLFSLLDQLSLREMRPREALTLKVSSSFFHIPFSRISFVEVMNKRLYFNLTDGGVQEIAGVLKDYEDLLLSRMEFVRCHRSYIVNLLQAAEISPNHIRTLSGKLVPVSRALYNQVQKDYIKLLFEGDYIGSAE